MTCSHHFVLCAEEPGTAFPLVLDSPPGRRSKRTRWFTGEARGVALSTATNLTPVGLPDIELDLLREARVILIEELAERRRKHRSTLKTLAALRVLTCEIMAREIG